MRRYARTILTAAGILLLLAIGYLYHLHSRSHRAPDLELLTILGRTDLKPDYRPGRWRPARGSPGGAETDPDIEFRENLLAFPYLRGYREAPDVKNVTIHFPERSYPGLNLFTSGHAPEALVVDMSGRVLHSWGYETEKIFPDLPPTPHGAYWRRAHWFPDGSILAILEGIGILKLDRESNLLWAHRGGFHHQAVVSGSGNIYVLFRRARVLPRIHRTEPVLEDLVAILDPDGNLLEEHSILESLENSEYRMLLAGMKTEGDIFHTNSLFVFDGNLTDRSPHFREGNVLVSILYLDTIAILDLSEGRVVWAQSGRANRMWKNQHDPVPLPNGNILLFDNLAGRNHSKIVEFDPFRGRVLWQYVGGRDGDLFSERCGANQRLPNGNTLITESDAGRAFEVTPGKEIVWEFFNPYRAGKDSRLIASLLELVRVETDYFPWLEVGDPGGSIRGD